MKKNINEILEDYKKIYPNKEWETPKLVLETFETCDIELNNNTIIYLAFITWNYELYCHKQMTDNNCKLSPYVKASCIMYVINELLTKICKKGNATIAIIAAFKILDNELGNNYLEEFLANNNKFNLKLDNQYSVMNYNQYIKETYNNVTNSENTSTYKPKINLFKKNNG